MVLLEWGDHGGIRTLLDLIEEHPTAFEYDWRTRFGIPLSAVFAGEMTWREAWSLTIELIKDPTSRVAAAVGGLDHPVSREWMVLADAYDVLVAANTSKKHKGKVKPYPRPWPDRDRSKSKRPKVSQKRIIDALRARGHTI